MEWELPPGLLACWGWGWGRVDPLSPEAAFQAQLQPLQAIVGDQAPFASPGWQDLAVPPLGFALPPPGPS